MIICQNQNHELSLSSKDPNQDLNDIEVLFPLKLNSKSQNSDVGSLKVQESYPNHDEKFKPQSGTSSFFKAQSRTYRTVIIFASSKWIIKSQNSDQRGLSKLKKLYPFNDQNAKPKSGTSSVLQFRKSGLKRYGGSLHIQTNVGVY